MLKKVFCMVLFLCFFCFPVIVSAEEPMPGEVLFAQRYADFSDPRETGIRIGTGGGTPDVSVKDGLCIDVTDDRKAYLLLPDMPDGAAWTDTYTVEFSFRFTELSAENGYFGFLLTSVGDAPLNRSELILRAKGSFDDAGELSRPLADALQAGETVTVTVPVLRGTVYELTVSCGAEAQTIALPSVRTVWEGQRGFVLRNASALVESVVVTNGIDFDEKIGLYATESYRPAVQEPGEIPAPSTGEMETWAFVCLIGGFVGCLYISRRRVRA